jgi:hypothetical protein
LPLDGPASGRSGFPCAFDIPKLKTKIRTAKKFFIQILFTLSITITTVYSKLLYD